MQVGQGRENLHHDPLDEMLVEVSVVYVAVILVVLGQVHLKVLEDKIYR